MINVFFARLVLFFCVLVTLSSCNWAYLMDGGSYVHYYYDGDLTFHAQWENTESRPCLALYLDGKYEVTYDRGSAKAGELNKLHNDTRYFPRGGSVGLSCYAKDIESIELYSDKAFDANHPAGSSLLDLVVVHAPSEFAYVQNGYEDRSPAYKWGDMIHEKDLYMLSDRPLISFHFEFMPQYEGVHDLCLVVTLSTGKVISLRSTIDFFEYENTDVSWVSAYNLPPRG